MKCLIYTLSLFAFIAVVFLSVPPAPAQEGLGAGFSLVKADYAEYARLFQTGREPNLSPIGNER